jgi:hypothetical protein
MATEAIQTVTGKLLIYVLILMIMFAIIVFFVALQWVSENSGFSIIAQLQFLVTFLLSSTSTRIFLQLWFTVFLCNCLGSMWLSPIRLLRVENTLYELPMRYANCCCLQIRCVCV